MRILSRKLDFNFMDNDNRCLRKGDDYGDG